MVMSLSNKCGWIYSMKNRFLLKILMLVFPSSVRSLLLIVKICMIVSWKSNHLAFNWKNVDLLWRFCRTGKGYRLRGLIANGWIRISRWLMLCQKPFTMRPFWKFVKEKKCLCFSTRPFSAPRRREPSEENPSSLLPMLSLKTRCQGKKRLLMSVDLRLVLLPWHILANHIHIFLTQTLCDGAQCSVTVPGKSCAAMAVVWVQSHSDYIVACFDIDQYLVTFCSAASVNQHNGIPMGTLW